MKARRSNLDGRQLKYDKQWKINNPEKVKAWSNRWKKETNPKRYKETNSVRQKRYRLKHIDQVRIWKVKYQNKRYREMGTIPLNKWFDGCEGHHVDKDHIIYIPIALHRSVWHNHKKQETLTLINAKAFEYLFKTS